MTINPIDNNSNITEAPDKGRPGFYIMSRAWYATAADREKPEIVIGIYHASGATSGEFGIRWHDFSGRSVPRIEAFMDACDVFFGMTELHAALPKTRGEYASLDDIVALLLGLGLEDRTPYVEREGSAPAEVQVAAPQRRVTTALPPDPEGMNDDRAEWAGEALQTFVRRTGSDFEDSLGDLLGDLMHWADRNGFDFDLALGRAQGHYAAETSLQ